MRIEICIAKEKMTKMPNGAVDALKEELTRRISKRYDDVEVIVKATSNDGLSVTRTADKDSAKTFAHEFFPRESVSAGNHSILALSEVHQPTAARSRIRRVCGFSTIQIQHSHHIHSSALKYI